MAVIYKCDICNNTVEKAINVGWRLYVCKNCWGDKKKWLKIHSIPVENNNY